MGARVLINGNWYYYMAGELTDKHKAEFQKFIDFSTSVGTLPEKVDITKYLQAY